jgi:putative hemolysin
LDPDPKHLMISLFPVLNMESGDPSYFMLGVIVLALLLVLLGLISSSEVSLLTTYKDYKSNDGLEHDDDDKLLHKLLEKPTHLLSTIIIINTVCTIAIIIVANYLLSIMITKVWYVGVAQWIDGLGGFGLDIDHSADVVALIIKTVLIMMFIVIFGESIPKLYASQKHRNLFKPTTALLKFSKSILTPINSLLGFLASKIEAGHSQNNKYSTQVREDIDTAIELTMSDDTEASMQEADILKGIVKFSDVTTKQIMQTRLDIVAIDENTGFKELMRTVKESAYSRIPVFRDDLDNIIGIIYVKDLLQYHNRKEDFEWKQLVRNTVLFVPESKKIDELLREFQRKRAHLGIVVDEYGGTLGLVTLEDIMEEIVGEIRDEFDQEENVEFVKIADNHFIFDGKSILKDVCRIVGLEPSYFDHVKGEADSLGGLVLAMVGQLPTIDRELLIKDVTIKVVSVNKRRIEKLSLIKNQKI